MRGATSATRDDPGSRGYRFSDFALHMLTPCSGVLPCVVLRTARALWPRELLKRGLRGHGLALLIEARK